MNLDQFAGRIRKRAAQIEKGAGDAVRKYASIASQTIILATPVDTGRAKGNWFASVGTPILSPQEDNFDPSGQLTIASNNFVISTRLDGETIYISNNLHYIGHLNKGGSSQAPPNYVQDALVVAKSHFQSVRILGP